MQERTNEGISLKLSPGPDPTPIPLSQFASLLGRRRGWGYYLMHRGVLTASGYFVRLETIRDDRGRLCVTRSLWESLRDRQQDPMYVGRPEDEGVRRGYGRLPPFPAIRESTPRELSTSDLSTSDLAQVLRVKGRTVAKWIRQGRRNELGEWIRLPAIRRRKRYKISPSDVLAWLEKNFEDKASKLYACALENSFRQEYLW